MRELLGLGQRTDIPQTDEGRRYKITEAAEECLKCGRCCRAFEIRLDGNDPSVTDARSCIINNFRVAGIVVAPVLAIKLKIEGQCVHLTKENLCDNYEHRPQLCRDFDCEALPLSAKLAKRIGTAVYEQHFGGRPTTKLIQ